MNYEMKHIGVITSLETGEKRITLAENYASGLLGLQDFSHIMVVWWAHNSGEFDASFLRIPSPYTHSDQIMGIFSTRSPIRPNNICVSVATIAAVTIEQSCIDLYYIDADNGSPVLDIKPYHPSCDRVEYPKVPTWCNHWPVSLETSGDFDWEKEFRF